jgi:hypothetical protein
VTGNTANDLVEVLVECEQKWLRGTRNRRWTYAILALVFFPFRPLSMLFAWTFVDEKREELGYETTVRVPLRACRSQHDCVSRYSQRRLCRLLRTVPMYAKLLDEYPGATVHLAKTGS